MNTLQVIIGFLVSTFGGALVIWLLIEKIMWKSVKTRKKLKEKPSAFITIPLGLIERALYTAALIIGAPEWVAVWFAAKVAVGWGHWKGQEWTTYNLFLLSNALSIAFGYIGAGIALGQIVYFQ